ncbi:MAG: response regulator [Tannerella sp.]|nr:response regulator [Tannerella sp.]
MYFKHIGMDDGLSQTSVMSIYQDVLGRMWFGTREGISLYNGEQMRIFKNFGKENRDDGMNSLLGREITFITGNHKGDVFFKASGSMVRYDIRTEQFYEISSNVAAIASDKGNIWVACNDTIYTYDAEGDSLCLFMKTNLADVQCLYVSGERIRLGARNGLYLIEERNEPVCIVDGIQTYRVFESSSGEVWIGAHTEGLFRITRDGEIIHYTENTPPPHRLLSNRIREFAEDKYGHIWFGTFLGLQMYNPYTDVITSCEYDYLPGKLSHSSVFSLYIDSQETIWVGTYYGGVNYFNPEKEIFTHYIDNPTRKECLSHPFVGHMAEDKDGNIWICTEGGGLNRLDRRTRTFTYYTAGPGNALLQNNLKAIAYDEKRHRLYIGSHYGGLARYDINTGIFHNYLNYYTDEQSMPFQIIRQIIIYDDKVYTNATNGIFSLDPATDRFRYLCEASRSFTIDSNGNIWIATTDKLIRINLSDIRERKEYLFSDHHILFEISHIIQTKRGDLYFVTLGSGLFRYDDTTDSFIHYTEANGLLLSDYCYFLIETNTGELLITSDKGITFFNPCTEDVNHYKLKAHLPISSITFGCGILICRNNELFIGGSDGLTSFRQEDLYKKEKDYSLYFSELYIHNTRACPGSEDGVLNKILPYTRSITLKHNQNNLIVHFASNNYVDIQKNIEYEYQLVGFDREWVSTSLTHIYYTNLNPGRYKLIVREKDHTISSIQKKTITLNIIIRRPWYNTIWAWLFYLLATFSIALVIFRTLYARRTLTLSLKHERAEKERNEELNQAKLHFFTSISHEFRTPLTLIISQIDSIFQTATLSPTIHNKISKISKNANQLLNMISELLEFRKLEQQYVSLRVSEQDLIPFLKDIYLSYGELAIKRHITFRFHPHIESVRVWFDPVQLQKVFNNLLSNALKYTEANGHIEIFVDETDSKVLVKVLDNGIGISEDDTPRIFERFYQAASGKKMSNAYTGTGIGLALSKSIVALHHGDISVQSKPGYGSIFTVALEKGKNHFERDGKSILLDKPEEPMIQKDSFPDIVSPHDSDELGKMLPDREKRTRYTVLIVEDNEELIQILSRLFEPFYRVIQARNGEEGLQMARTGKPDLIVSDVMMPVMNGIEMCNELKNNIELCHIPLVLLTALDTVEHNLEGLQQGADDYIGKPFHAKILLMRCNNLIKNRLLVKNQLSKQIDFGVQLQAASSLDQKLMSRITEIIDKYIDNAEFDINTLARELCMGRSTLFTKFKSLTGMTPNEYIRNRRIKHAAVMLNDYPDLQIAEVSERLGFTSARYFSHCFKSQFGVSPQKFRKQ